MSPSPRPSSAAEPAGGADRAAAASREPRAPTLDEALGAFALDAAGRASLGTQVAAAFEAVQKSPRRGPGRLAAVRALRTDAPAAAIAPARLVPVVLALRERGSGSAEDVRRRAQAADALLLHLCRTPREEPARTAGRGLAAFDPMRRTLERLLRVLPDAVLTVRASGQVGLWSVGASRLTGRRRYEVQRRGLDRCFTEPDFLARLLADVDQGGRVDGREMSLLHASGHAVPVRVHAARLRPGSRAPDPDRYLLVLHDRTEVHRIRARLIETEKLSAMAKIAGSVAHEFRNPLNSLFLSTDLLEDELEGHGDVQAAIGPTLAAIREEIERLNQIITHYLALSQIGGEEPEELDLGLAVAEFVEDQHERAGERGVTLRARIDPGPHPIRLDRHQLRRVLLNLADNAFDALAEQVEGGRSGAVTLLVRRMRRSTKLTVKDNGPGIPDDLRERVLEPFFTSKSGGSGLGLYLVREIVIASGGSLSLSSTEGRGTGISIRWPLAESTSDRAS
ncbi:MAG: ATP-binding protein [Planctomycetota bacterium]|nr:hypothetical protein [Planctomycetota bacterium]MCB9824720.1 hypothetical protein [Planctomycetota bacterium]MCB9899869.1 hypothetical protein [Planctomycetota bacterium]